MNAANEKVKFLLNWNRFSEHLLSCMTKLMTDISYSDIIIATADKHMIYAHRFVLANSSKYFQRLLQPMNRQKNIQLVVALPEIKYEIFKILMNYMYKGETQVPHELLPSVIKAGQILEINGLVDLGEGENHTTEASLVKFNSANECYSRSSIIHSPKTNVQADVKKNEHFTSRHDKIRLRKQHPPPLVSKHLAHAKKRPYNAVDIDSTSEPDVAEENESNSKKKSFLEKSKDGGARLEKKEVIHMSVKKRHIARDLEKDKERPSSSTENSTAKKSKKLSFIPHIVPQITIKTEKEENTSWENDAHVETNDIDEEITIKTEAPDEVEEISYNELQCDYCHQTYSNPSEWVRHMTDHHGDRGYQTYKDFDKDVNTDAVYTCVICSSLSFSASDWAKHLRMCHTEKELAAANLAASRKTDSDNLRNTIRTTPEREKTKKK